MDRNEILDQVESLLEQERGLREQVQHGEMAPTEEHQQLRHLETALDQCWDLLRQRRALQHADEDPDRASVRRSEEVEGYLQ